jgi:ComF family protein
MSSAHPDPRVEGVQAPGRAPAPWREILDFLLPARCLGCDDRLGSGGLSRLVCPVCLSRLREPPWPRCPRCHHPTGTGRATGHCLACQDWPEALQRARAAVVLEDPAARLVHALKYEGWRELAPLMASRFSGLLGPSETPADAVVVPTPTTAARRRERGYNQATLLAVPFAAQGGWTLVEALERAGGGGSQVSLDPSARRSNVRGVFSVPPCRSTSLVGRHVLLVDDVLTTGATASAAALELERAGALGVSLITFARALPGRQRSGSRPA